jgi:hypothetical protein
MALGRRVVGVTPSDPLQGPHRDKETPFVLMLCSPVEVGGPLMSAYFAGRDHVRGRTVEGAPALSHRAASLVELVAGCGLPAQLQESPSLLLLPWKRMLTTGSVRRPFLSFVILLWLVRWFGLAWSQPALLFKLA